MNTTTPTTVTLPVYAGRLRFRHVPGYLPAGNNHAATLVAAGRLGDGESLHWATDEDSYLLPLSLGVGQVVMFASDLGGDHPRFFGLVTQHTDKELTLDQYDSAQGAWDAARTADNDQRPVWLPTRDELIRFRSRVRVQLLDLEPRQAVAVLTGLVDDTDAMAAEVAAAVLDRVHTAVHHVVESGSAPVADG